MASISAGIAWFKATFGARIAAATQHKPYSLDLFAALAVQETFEIWGGMFATEKEDRILPLCVGDTLDRSSTFPTTKADLLKVPSGEKAFRIARLGLEALASHNAAYAKVARNPDKFCHGFGIFQYDLQHFKKSDPGFFLDLKWFEFATCLDKAISELDASKDALYGTQKFSLTDEEMVFVAIGYNWGAGKTNIHGDFKQGFENSGKYYGELVWEYLQLAHQVSAAGGRAPPTLVKGAGA